MAARALVRSLGAENLTELHGDMVRLLHV